MVEAVGLRGENAIPAYNLPQACADNNHEEILSLSFRQNSCGLVSFGLAW